MRIRVAYLRLQGQSVAVFAANGTSNSDTSRTEALAQLVSGARTAGLKVDKAVLRFQEGGRWTYFGSPDLAQYLANNGLWQWTHWLSI